MEANFPEDKRKKMFVKVTRWLLLGAVILLSVSAGMVNKPQDANTQSILSKVAYFEFLFVLLALSGMAIWLYIFNKQPIKDGQLIVSTVRLVFCQPALERTKSGRSVHRFALAVRPVVHGDETAKTYR